MDPWTLIHDWLILLLVWIIFPSKLMKWCCGIAALYCAMQFMGIVPCYVVS